MKKVNDNNWSEARIENSKKGAIQILFYCYFLPKKFLKKV
jgi:hypothetical protein